MIEKSVKIVPPLDDAKITALESFLSRVSRESTKTASGTYIADGTSKLVKIGFSPNFIIIGPYLPQTGDLVLSFALIEGKSYILGTGFVDNAVLTYERDGITLGVNLNVNTRGNTYFYYAIG